MASTTRAVRPIRSALRLAVSRPASPRPLRWASAVRSIHPAVPYTRSFGTAGVRWESEKKAAPATGAPSTPKKWDFEMIKEISENKPANILLIDVREPNELRSTGTIPTSVNIPIVTHPNAFCLPPDQFLALFGFEKPPTTGPDAPELVFFCKAGVRGRAAAQLASAEGYKSVGDYAGSWLDWSDKGGKAVEYDGSGEVWEGQQ
ncbi:uncharacterized protein DNG_08504 [Cephalotrichum gorgonifer]|uniref:Rhodanese domain-containing protein n=1 Tax=Cephalotrichum gorgonifer TaxID=2041049 RepID=A0AAE8N6L0_9PEZI|nr:uncharacterized protein DNG_08504 [Cephalotrichum gorgonifer]